MPSFHIEETRFGDPEARKTEPSQLELESIQPTQVANVSPNGRLNELARGREALEKYFAGIAQFNICHIPPREGSAHHYHPESKTEILTVGYGEIEVILENPVTKQRVIRQVKKGYEILIPKGIAHGIYNRSPDTVAVFNERATMAFEPKNAKKDVVPYDI